MNPQRFDELCDLWRDGLLDEAQARELNDLLRNSDLARERFRVQSRFHGLLHSAVAAAMVEMAVDSFSPIRPSRRLWAIPKVSESIRSSKWLMAASLLLAVGGGISAWKIVADMPTIGPVVASVGESSGVNLTYQQGGDRVAVEAGSAIHSAAYDLHAGSMELRYPSGARLIIQAPAKFDLTNGSHVKLERGRLSARIPQEAIGFTVETPTANVVDLGTEFGVSAEPDNSEVHVFEGKVLVKTQQDPEPLTLLERRASRIDHATGTPTGLDVRPNGFLLNFNESSGDVIKVIRDLAPIAFYRMVTSMDGVGLQDDRSNQFPGELLGVGSHQSLASGFGGGTALSLGGAAGQVYARIPRFPMSKSGELTVCAWVIANSRPRWGSIVKNWSKEGTVNNGGQFHFGIYKDDGDLEVHVHDVDGNEVGVRENVPMPLGVWQFVAFTMDGKMLRLYRNGLLVAEAPCRGLYQRGPNALGIGVKLGFDALLPDPRNAGFWDGRIDNVAIFHRALTQEDVSMLSSASGFSDD